MAVFEQKGGTSGGSYASYFTGRLTVTETGERNIEINQSKVYYKLELISGSSGRFSGNSASYSVTLDGVVRNSGSGTYSSQSYNTAQTITEGYAWIDHTPDGTKTLSCSAVLDFTSGSYSPGDFTPSGTMQLTTIPRASAITGTDANIGSASTIVINRAVDSFTHTITYSFKNLTGTIATKTANTTISWTIPTTFFQQIPNDSDGIVTLTCKTFNGDTELGTTTTILIASVPYSGTYNSTPVITSATAIDTNTTTKNLTGNNKRLVLYKSIVEVSAVGQCKNYAGFKYFRENNIYDLETTTSVSGGTTTVNGTRTYSTSTTPTFDKTQFKLTLIDTRNSPSDTKILNQANGDFTIVPYVPLTINASAERINPTSGSVYLSFSGNFYNGYYDASNSNFNTLTIKWRYKEAPSGSWSSWITLTRNTHYKYGSGNTYYSGSGSSQAKITLADVFNYQKSYILEISCADRLSTVTVQKPITQGIPIHDEGVDANGNNYFNVNGGFYQNNENVLQKHIMTYGKNTNQSFTANQTTTVELNTVISSVGNKLSTSNYGIKIGSGVSKVKINAAIWINSVGYKFIIIGKNNDEIITAISPETNGNIGLWATTVISDILIDVQENDVIYLKANVSSTGTCQAGDYNLYNTYLTVEVVG